LAAARSCRASGALRTACPFPPSPPPSARRGREARRHAARRRRMSRFPYTACLIVPPVGDAILASTILPGRHASRGDGLRSCEASQGVWWRISRSDVVGFAISETAERSIDDAFYQNQQLATPLVHDLSP
jgi:hypothetical protein